jgi:NADPH:quinone reductase-like Zn-dependent oxidoreductase
MHSVRPALRRSSSAMRPSILDAQVACPVAPADGKRLITRALTEAAAGRIRPVIGQTYPLEGAADAHRAIEAQDVVGKTLLLAKEVA